MCLPADCCFSEQALKMRNGARFITGDYKSRHEGADTNMLKDLDLPTLQQKNKCQIGVPIQSGRWIGSSNRSRYVY
jgi:hypothetical protein